MADFPQRKPNRLKGYKYNQNGAYFITICVQNRANLLGGIVGDGFSVPKEMQLSEQGKIVRQFIFDLSAKYRHAHVENYIIMPNHIHMILTLENGANNLREDTETSSVNGTKTPSPTVGAIIGWYKYHTTVQINKLAENEICKIWQRSFYDHVIRSDEEYYEILDYISMNPQRWEDDSLFSDIQGVN